MNELLELIITVQDCIVSLDMNTLPLEVYHVRRDIDGSLSVHNPK
jgi:hypothetical protein